MSLPVQPAIRMAAITIYTMFTFRSIFYDFMSLNSL